MALSKPNRKYGWTPDQPLSTKEQQRFEVFKFVLMRYSNTRPAMERAKTAQYWMKLYMDA